MVLVLYVWLLSAIGAVLTKLDSVTLFLIFYFHGHQVYQLVGTALHDISSYLSTKNVGVFVNMIRHEMLF